MTEQERPLLVIGNYNYSSWSLRAWFFMQAVGMDFDVERLPLDTPEFAERIDEFSPTGRVPVLLLGDEIIWDSLAICMEVAERLAPHAGWPTKPTHRALARSICSEMHSGYPALRAQMPMNCRATDRKVERTPELDADIWRVCHIWRENRARHADDGPWLFGHFSIVDAMFAPVVFRFRTYGVELDEEEAAYARTVLEHPAIRRWLAQASAEAEVIRAEESGT